MDVESIRQNLPSRDDIARALGLQVASPAYDMMTLLGIFSTGMILGAGLAVLFAPKPGEELRRDLATTVKDLGDQLNQRLGRAATSSASAPSASAA